MDETTRSAFAALIGKRCCRQRVGRGRSLSLGFGQQVPHAKRNASEPFYGEWELGTYSAAWRIVRAGRVICGSSEIVDSIDELDSCLQAIKMGKVTAIEEASQFEIRVKLDDLVTVDFMCASAADDEMFHIFGPGSLYVEYTSTGRWKIGSSDGPWG